MILATDVCVVGAGPAGLAAAVSAGQAGVTVALVDSAATVGGQYWRHPPSRPWNAVIDRDVHHDVGEFARLSNQAAALAREGALTYLPGQFVWTVSETPEGCRVRAVAEEPIREETVVDARLAILATGAMDRPLPFPGWDLPGVLTVGGLQSLLKGHGVLAGQRILLAGTGPLLLSTAALVLARGGTVAGVIESARPLRWVRHLRALAGVPARVVEGAGYMAALTRHRVTVQTSAMVIAACGGDRVSRVTSARIAQDGRVAPGSQHTHEVSLLAVSYGFTPRLELHAAAGCALARDAKGNVSVEVDDDQFTSCPGVLSAGEPTGIGGASLALVEGQIAGTAAARRLGRSGGQTGELVALKRRRRTLRAFAAAMASVYTIPSVWPEFLTDDTTICRCEEVTYAEIKRALELGASDVRTVKLLSRAGMGWCQGRICGYPVSCLIPGAPGGTADVASLRIPIAAPLPLSVLASAEQPTTPSSHLPRDPPAPRRG